MIFGRASLATCVLFGLALRVSGQDARVSAIPELSWRPVAVGAAVVGVAMLFDQRIASEVVDHGTAGSRATAQTLSRFGQVEVIAPVVGGLAVVGLLTSRPALTRTAGQLIGAMVTATVLTQPAKYLFGRRRPYQVSPLDAMAWSPFSGGTSFPSGHTAAAFALATTLGDASGSTVARLALYTLATGTAYGRVAESNHWLSDVVAGAGIGILSARFASGRIRVLGLRAPRILLGPRGAELSVTASLPLIR